MLDGYIPCDGLWPKIPLKKAGILILPPISDPIPTTEPPADKIQPSPPRREKNPSMGLIVYV